MFLLSEYHPSCRELCTKGPSNVSLLFKATRWLQRVDPVWSAAMGFTTHFRSLSSPDDRHIYRSTEEYSPDTAQISNSLAL